MSTSRSIILVAVLGVVLWPAATARSADWWDITPIDDEGWVTVTRTSLDVLSSGEPAISYIHNPGDWGGYDLKYAACEGDTWQTELLVEFINWTTTSLGVLPSGHPIMSFVTIDGTLTCTWFDGLLWDTEAACSVGNGGGHTSLVILPTGYPAISCCRMEQPSLDGELVYAWRDGEGWHSEVVDGEGSVGLHASLAVLPSGEPVISYYDETNSALKLAWRESGVWHIETADDDGDVGTHTSLLILPSGGPAISYRDESASALKFAWQDDTGWHAVTVDDQPGAGQGTSLAMLRPDRPAIAHFDGDRLRFSWLDRGQWRNTTVETVGGPGGYPSLGVLPAGQPIISYYFHETPERSRDSGLTCAVRRVVSGDSNCDSHVDFDDINAFVVALGGEEAYLTQYPECHWLLADCDEDGDVDFDDIDPFVALLGE